MLRIGLFALALVTAAMPALAQSDGNDAPMSAQEIKNPKGVEASRTAVKNTLKDPGSAQFGPIKVFRKADGSEFACGTVNAKNSYGGYVGSVPFYVMLISRSAGKDTIYVGVAAVDIVDDKYGLFAGQYPRCAAN